MPSATYLALSGPYRTETPEIESLLLNGDVNRSIPKTTKLRMGQAEPVQAHDFHIGSLSRVAWSSNGLELTGAGLGPHCTNDRRAAGVRCSDVLGGDRIDAFRNRSPA